MNCCTVTSQVLEQIVCSTDTRLSRLTEMILNGAESRQTTVMILINLQKAFYTLNHKIVLDKMKCVGFSDKTITWVHSYPTNRFIFVSVGISESGIIHCEVPKDLNWDLCCFCNT